MNSISPRFTQVKRRLSVLAGAGIAAALVLSGCTSPGGGSTDAPGTDGFVLGVSEVSTEIPFLATLDASIKSKAEELGGTATILDGNLDIATQLANIRTLISQKVDAILVICGDPTAPVDAINEAVDAGIPVFAVNAALDKAAKVVTYVGASDYDYGVAQGDLLIKALPDGGKVAVILGLLGGVPQVQRLAGLQDTIKDHPEIEIVAKPSDDFDNQKNLAAVQDLLAKYPEGTLDAIVAQGPELYVGANYAQEQGRSDILFIAGDYPTQVEDAIKSGAIYGTVDQSPVTQGETAAQFAFDWISGNKDKVKTPEFITDLPLVTKDTLADNPASWSF
ncbi:MAG: hypothetical protein JWP32_1741 [Schumannella sp.]|nr:hypothetical protein [Schumannella sp.]